MMIDDEILKQLQRINDEMLCDRISEASALASRKRRCSRSAGFSGHFVYTECVNVDSAFLAVNSSPAPEQKSPPIFEPFV